MPDTLTPDMAPTSTHLPPQKETCGATYKVAENLCPILSNDWVNDEYKLMVVSAPDVALAAEPGQFFHLLCPADGGKGNFLRRPMSIHRIDRANRQLHFLYKVQGAGTRGLATLTAGETLDALGPVGQGFTLAPGVRHVLILGRGVGLATLAPLAETAIAQGAAVTAVLSARHPDLMMGEEWLRDAGATTVIATDIDGSSAIDKVEAAIRARHADLPIDFMTTCGSNRLLGLVRKLAVEFGAEGQVALEQRMGCALGMCYACVKPFRKAEDPTQLTYKRVCWDGPVFDLKEVVSW